MKKLITLLTLGLIVLINVPAISQVSFTTDGSDPDPSAMLEWKSPSSGVLVPRMTQSERNAINGGTFATGLLIYQTDNSPGYYYYDGTAWQRIVGGEDSDWTISGDDMYNNNSGKIGIGTPTPLEKLSIDGNIYLGHCLWGEERKISMGSSIPLIEIARKPYSQQMILGSGVDIGSYGGFLFQIGQVDKMVMDSQGNLGIGNTSPSERLHVEGNMRLTGALHDANNEEGTNGQVLSTTGSGIDWVDASSISDGDWTLSGNDMYNNNSGNVGIGTTAPTYKLDVIGDVGILGSTADTEGIKLQTDFVYQNTSSRIFFNGRDINTYGFSWLYTGSADPTFDGTTFTLPYGHFYLLNHTNSLTGSIAMSVNRDNGRIGIGNSTASASAPLHVFTQTDVNPTDGGGLIIGLMDGINLAMDGNEIMARLNGAAFTLYLNHNGGNVAVSADGTGSLGVGTESPTQRLHVEGNMRSGTGKQGRCYFHGYSWRYQLLVL